MSNETEYLVIPGKFSDILRTEVGKKIKEVLTRPESVIAMKTASRLHKPAVLAVEQELAEALGDQLTNDRVKQTVGLVIRQILEQEGYVLDGQNKPVQGIGLFSKASRYAPPAETVYYVFSDSSDRKSIAIAFDRDLDLSLLPKSKGRGWVFWKVLTGDLAVSIVLGAQNIKEIRQEIESKHFSLLTVSRMIKAS